MKYIQNEILENEEMVESNSYNNDNYIYLASAWTW
jgi:hypothetical protein